jgi:membrane-bound serine protease (ClpP class)
MPQYNLTIRKFFLMLVFILSAYWLKAADTTLVYRFDIRKEIMPAMWRITQKAITEAEKINADLIIIHMNTYGGMLDAADSIRTRILNCKIPVYVFIDNNAASAGALISIAADRIYMRRGASIGAATVVDAEGKVVPDKYQSFMRSLMRATAETHGKDTLINGSDTILKWHRDPHIAEAMVDPSIYIKDITDTGKVLTLTTSEAIRLGFCEGEAETIEQVLDLAGTKPWRMIEFRSTTLESLIGFLINPIVQGILIMLIIAGIYFELQSPGIGFPLVLALSAAMLYFAPLYLEGLAHNWEILLFLAGLILIALEIFVVPGFGVTGIGGILLVVIGLSLSMIDDFDFSMEPGNFNRPLYALSIVLFSVFASLISSIALTSRLLTKTPLRKLVLQNEQTTSEGFIGVDMSGKAMVGKTGVAATVLRPSGKVEIDGDFFDASSECGFINQGENVRVTRMETGQIYVRRLK